LHRLNEIYWFVKENFKYIVEVFLFMFNEKKGQVTVFIIIGLVLLIVIGLVFYIYGGKLRTKTDVKFDATQVEPLKNYIEECIEKEGSEVIRMVAEGGGKVNPGFVYWYDGKKFSYLCYSTGFKPCENKVPFVRKEAGSEMSAELVERVKRCVNLDSLRKEGYGVQEGEMNLQAEVNDYSVLVTLDYPLTISKGGSVISERKFVHNFETPLGRLADIAMEIVESEITYGEFFYEPYFALHPEVIVARSLLGASKSYSVRLRDEPLEFRFAVRGWAE
jgi:hypothetical protein